MKENPPGRKDRIREAKRRERLVSVIIVLLIVLAIGLTTFYAVIPSLTKPVVKSPTTPLEAGQKAPDFTLPVVDANGLTQNKFSLGQTRGKVVLLEFMVSWCPHCQNMAFYVKDLAHEFQGRDFAMVTIAGTWQGASAESTAQFIRKYNSDWVHVLDGDNSISSTYGVTSTPTYFVLDRDGKIVARMEGETPIGDLAAEINRSLR